MGNALLGSVYSSHVLMHGKRQWHPTPVLLPGKSHGRRSLVGCSPWGRQESDTTEQLPFHFSLSCIGDRNGNPLQCSCLENPRDGEAWWAAVYGVTQSWTRLKRLSSSSAHAHSHMGYARAHTLFVLSTHRMSRPGPWQETGRKGVRNMCFAVQSILSLSPGSFCLPAVFPWVGDQPL